MCPGRARSSGRVAGVDQRADGGRSIGCADPGGGPFHGVDRHRERGALHLGVVRDHQGQAQVVEPLAEHGHADHAAGVADHERHGLGRDQLRRHDEVALVLTVGVVDHDHELAALDGLDRVLNVRERHLLYRLARSRGWTNCIMSPYFVAARSAVPLAALVPGVVPSVWRPCRPRGSRGRRGRGRRGW